MFKRVHQGGHHDVWCDGMVHKKTEGGFCYDDKPLEAKRFVKTFKCDCAYWQVLTAQYRDAVDAANRMPDNART